MRPIDEGMTWTQLEIDGHFFALRDPGSVTEVMSQIEAIARTEPSFLTIATAEGIASVLITPHTRVFVRTQSAGEADSEWEPSTLPPDWDL